MKCFLFFLVSIVSFNTFSQQKHVFSFSRNEFLLDNKPFRIISGEMHPARIPVEYWRHRVRMAKAMGCNTIAVYIFWNYHESRDGNFDFQTGNRDIAAFIRICQEEKMWVLLRPGPYVCAEWDFGGLPPYLLKIPDIKIRCRDSRYMKAVERYVNRLASEIQGLQCDKGGPVLMLQIENEYGSFGNDKAYLEELRKLWVRNGITIPFFTADGPTPWMLEAGNIDGAAIGLDSGGSEKDFEEAKRRNPAVPSFSSETYPGWLTHWGEKWARPDTSQLKKEVEFLLKNNKSFNLYVIHGGTNFGLTAGANAFSPTQYQPDITSYDYDAPINEQGRATAKYRMLRDLIGKYTDQKLPDPPADIPTIEIPPVKLFYTSNIWVYAKGISAVFSPQPLPLENLDQDQGFAIYSTKLIGHKGGKLTIWEPHDYALVFLDHKFIDTVFRDGGKWTIDLPPSGQKEPLLEILVEAMGHINFAQYMIDRKGITDRVTLNGMTLMNWAIYPAPIDKKFIESGRVRTAGINERQGMFFMGNFMLKETGDTYFDMSAYSKGYVFINGLNLGRYWNIGPQQRLYCPASWLKKGENEIMVFDLHQLKAASISGKKTLE
jgi:beta-galactosidase